VEAEGGEKCKMQLIAKKKKGIYGGYNKFETVFLEHFETNLS